MFSRLRCGGSNLGSGTGRKEGRGRGGGSEDMGKRIEERVIKIII